MPQFNFRKLFHFQNHHKDIYEEQHQAGTGFMFCLSDAIRDLQKKGYAENLVPHFDHFCCRSGEMVMYPRDIFIDEMIRFENSSDPDDQSLLYAITCDKLNLKGLYVESYGVYHDELSVAMLERIKYCRSHPKATLSQPVKSSSMATL